MPTERFLVVSDVYPTVTTELAAVVLPSALWVEKNGVFGNSERRTQQWFKMVDPPRDARDDVWQMLAVARRMFELGFEGMKDRDGNFLLSVHDDDGKEVEALARPYEAPPEVPDDEYPFWLCTGRVLEHWHTATMTGRVPALKQAMPRAYVELNLEDALKLDVRTGDMVRIKSRRGSIDLAVWLRGRSACPPGLIFVPFFDETKLINEVTRNHRNPAISCLRGGPNCFASHSCPPGSGP